MYALTTPQKNIWNLQKTIPNTSISNLCGAVFFESLIDNCIIESAINKFVELQGGMRIQFDERDCEVVQYIEKYQYFNVPFMTFSNKGSFEEFAQKIVQQPFEMLNKPMYRFIIFELNGKSGVLACLNHLISDAWTFSLLAKGVYNLCREFEIGTVTEHESHDYVEFIQSEEKYLASERCKKDEFYWSELYAEKPEICPIKMTNTPVSAPTAKRFTTILITEQTQKINWYREENHVSQAVLFETAMLIYLARVNSDNKQITIGVPVLNRKTKSEKSTVGMFISTTPLTVDISMKDTALSLCKKVTDAHSGLFRHQRYPYSSILIYIRGKHKFNGNLYVMVSYQNAKTDESITTQWFSNGYSEVPFTLHIDNRDGANSFTLNVDYQTEVFRSAEEVELIVNRLMLIIDQIIDMPEITVSDINIIPDEEYQKVIYDFNDTAVDYPRDKCIHELFSEQAAKTPDKIALVFENKKFTYRQLDEMSNSLAHYLREEKGIKPNDIIPIIAKRSWHVIVAMFGVLKAGGAYMPVDPTYPIDRIEYMISEVKAKIALTYGFTENISVSVFDLENFDYSSNCAALRNVNYSDDKCYALFTSGTTGKPKAAIVTHHNLGNFVNNNNNNNNRYQCNMLNTCHTVLALGTYTFDITVFEIYLTLLNGLTMVMSNEHENLSVSLLARLIEKNDVDVIHSTPTKMLMYLEDKDFQKASRQLKMMMIGAETFTKDFHNKIKKYTNAVVYNGYGPTETTIAVSFKRINCSTYVVHELFSEQAAKTPDKIALIFENKKSTYKQLDEMSNSLAHYLREEKGIKPNDIIPIIAKRSWHIIVAMLGVLKAGGAYTLIDSNYPTERINYLIDLCSSEIVLICGCEYTNSVELEYFDYTYNVNPLTNCNEPSNLFCAIHTSGSTCTPKLTTLTHANISHYIKYSKYFFKNTKQTISTTIITFDAFIQETIVAMCNDTTVILCTDIEMTNQTNFERIVNQYSNSFLFQTPTKLLNYIRNSKDKKFIKNISCFVIGGEIFPDELLNLISKYNPDCKVYNIYGPTETTICATTDDVIDEIDITIGKPIANTQIYILDKERKPLPIGVAGELCISGDGVGKGYLNRPELTAEKFIPNPFIEGKTMYCTGDLARWRADGELEYLGRIDTQVKIRGLRIELGEIESVMSSFDGIRLTAVADKRDENNRQYLVGYYTAETKVDEKALRQHLSAKLPKYMIPNYFVHLAEMPMTASEKTDRKNLPLPDFTQSKDEYSAPETDTEIKIASIWSNLLKIDNVGKTDDFYNLGGDSLLAIAMLNHLENTFGTQITMKDILENPVLENLAIVIDKTEKKTSLITVTNSDKYVLLPQQKAIYAVCSKNPQTMMYNMPAKVKLDKSIDRKKLMNCFHEIVNAHRSLKTFIKAENNEIYGIYDETADICFENYSDEDISGFIRPFDLNNVPLIRIGFTETSMLFDMHHIIADGESLNIILRDLAKLYYDEKVVVSEAQYSDYAEYFHNADFLEHKEYFKNMLKCDFEPVILPEKKNHSEEYGISKIYQIDNDIFAIGKKFARENGLTETMLFLGVYGILLSKFTAKSEVLSSIILTNRTHRETQNIVGMFVNTLPVFISASGTISKYFARIKELLLNLFEYQELPFFDIAEAVGMTDKSVINTSFVYQADGEKKLSVNNIELEPEFIDTHTSKFDLTFELTPNENGCAVRIEYNSRKYEEELIDKLFAAYERIISRLYKETVSEISVLSEEEYQKVIYDFNDTAVDYPRDKCIHELFGEQAAKTPDKIALIFEDKKFTYKQLDEMSNSLAHYLREEKGIKPNDIIPIIAKRSWHIIVAMFGVLKAGGAYMPVDPSYPIDRIKYMIDEAKSKVALVFGYEEKLSTDTVHLDSFDYEYKKDRIENLNVSDDLCYLIFTSGSTGKPKGTMLTHANVRNYANNDDNNNVIHKIIKNGHESVVSVTNIVFDIFVTESILPILNGLTIYFASDDEVFSQEKLSVLILNNNIDVMQTTPTKMRGYMLDKDSLAYLSKLKTIILGGEALTSDLYLELKKYTDAEIYNIYGPAETTVWSTNAQVMSIDITIGKPIANTQIYILDKNRKPLPIGVAGELCISGDGVGKGYLNRSELTAEKFISNPFIEGKTMYCTGDLARWRADGELEYLGRVDTQVKIRGLRIELGEIESVMSSFDGIRLTAVADKRDENNRQYLVGYYTAETKVDEKTLRQHLSAKLPKYMIPNYFVHLAEMPMTASGKTDRKNLPLPDFTQSKNEYVAPKTDTEIKLCGLVGQLFGLEKISVTDDFFELGGDSLKAIEYIAKAHNIGVEIGLQDVFDYPTVQELCRHLEVETEKETLYIESDFEKYKKILSRNVLEENFVPNKKSLGNILLTGATGFLGAHILDVFLREETGKVYCLVKNGEKKLRDTLKYYFDSKYENEISKRIIPVVGDITNQNLSDNIPDDVQTVIYAAATVKHYGAYQYFHEVNVRGTQNVINFAKSVGARLIHISTISVSGNSFADAFTLYRSEEEKYFDEQSLYIGQELDNVYVRSKFEAEMTVLDAVIDGLDAKIIRVGNLTNRASDYKFQQNYQSNAFLTRIKAALEFGRLPDYLMPLYAEFSPIDETAEGVIKIAQYAEMQNVFHLNSNRPIYFTRLLEVLEKLNIPMEVVSGEQFSILLQDYAKNSETEYIYEAFQNDMDQNGNLVYDSNIRIINDFTVEFLKMIGFEWTQTDYDYIKGYVEYFRNLGYLEV